MPADGFACGSVGHSAMTSELLFLYEGHYVVVVLFLVFWKDIYNRVITIWLRLISLDHKLLWTSEFNLGAVLEDLNPMDIVYILQHMS